VQDLRPRQTRTKYKFRQDDVSVYVNTVDIISLRHQCKYMEHKGKNDTNRQTDANFCWMRSSLLAAVDVIEFQTTEAYYNLDLIKVSYIQTLQIIIIIIIIIISELIADDCKSRSDYRSTNRNSASVKGLSVQIVFRSSGTHTDHICKTKTSCYKMGIFCETQSAKEHFSESFILQGMLQNYF
jgi:hypothetical protein